MCGLHIREPIPRAPAGSVLASIRAVIAAMSSHRRHPSIGTLLCLARRSLAPIARAAMVDHSGPRQTAAPVTERAMAMIHSPCHADAYGHAALRAEVATLATTPPGSRNHALNRTAFSLFQLVAVGELNEAEVFEALERACVANGLAADDGWRSVRATIRSGRRAGLKHPRSRGAP